ncbi:hypothetical protein CWI35_04300 [[Bacillus] caldolyticus]|uniref:Uncharacterized protein n=2 Tax=Geobacillus thermoleovorans group TaxID=1505648 RepID=A0A2Z3N2N2_GEOTH|nr:hypothetical protein CWI35_04300 [[Bacillus] caldolyticus]AWO73332.1 hypothetical protein C1N76_01245 [Geobacillus thermoleovorans]TLS33660.1 hypothetical protein FDK15_05890 [Geobacillus thermoleovorans]
MRRKWRLKRCGLPISSEGWRCYVSLFSVNVRRDGEQTLLMGVSMNMRALSGGRKAFFSIAHMVG